MTTGEDCNAQGRSLAWQIPEAIAESKGVEPTDLDFHLVEHINIEAVNTLLDDENGSWTLTFELPDYTVTVTSDETILVDGKQKDGSIDN